MTNDWKHTHGLSDADIEEMAHEIRSDFLLGVIDEGMFRRRLARIGFNATEIDAEVKDNES